MTVYSDFSGRRTAQVIGDVVTALLVAISIVVGVLVHDAIVVLGDVGRSLEEAGNGFSGTMTDAGDVLGDVPLIGGGIRGPFDAAAGAGDTLAGAGAAQAAAVDTFATILGVVVAVLPILVILLIWAFTRLRFMIAATELRALSRLSDGTEVLALRALTTAPARELSRIATGPVAGWRERRPDVLAALAAVELRSGGLRGGES